MIIRKFSNSNKTFILDDCDALRLSGRKVQLNVNGYAQFSFRNRTTMLHRFVMRYGGIHQVDHINNNKLDNRKENLQIISSGCNKSKTPTRPTLCFFRNVRRYPKLGKFAAYIRLNWRTITSKRFETQFQAAVEAQNLFEIYRPSISLCIPFEKGWVNTLQ